MRGNPQFLLDDVCMIDAVITDAHQIGAGIDGGVTETLVLLEMTADELQLRAQFAGPPSDIPPRTPKSLGL